MKREAGVTLIELLIAVTLVAMLSVGMLFAIRVGLNAMDRSNDRLMSNRKAVSVQRILEEQISGLMPVTALCTAGGDGPPAKIPFFQGEQSTLRIVSSYSMREGQRGYARILEYQVIPGEDGVGVRLIVNESLYTGARSAGAMCLGSGPDGPQFRPVDVGPNSFVLADKLEYCRLSYREPLPPPAMSRWVLHWIKPTLPDAIRIELAPLDPDAARLQVQTMTIPIKVTRYPMERYDF